MDKGDARPDTNQAPKDFLALAHGQEWVSFYESFDKLVQDNLARSAELLRRAMALPEVADREVAQVRSEMELKLTAERQHNREVIAGLQDDLAAGIRQASVLARSVGSLLADLDRLNQRIGTALNDDSAPPAAEPQASYQAANPALEPPPIASAPEPEPVGAVAEGAEVSSAPLSAAAEETVEEAAPNGIAAADADVDGTTTDSESDDDADREGEPTTQRSRPNWLTVSRTKQS